MVVQIVYLELKYIVEDQLLANEAKDSTTSIRELQNLHDVKKGKI
jgi:hypothetical protein